MPTKCKGILFQQSCARAVQKPGIAEIGEQIFISPHLDKGLEKKSIKKRGEEEYATTNPPTPPFSFPPLLRVGGACVFSPARGHSIVRGESCREKRGGRGSGGGERGEERV